MFPRGVYILLVLLISVVLFDTPIYAQDSSIYISLAIYLHCDTNNELNLDYISVSNVDFNKSTALYKVKLSIKDNSTYDCFIDDYLKNNLCERIKPFCHNMRKLENFFAQQRVNRLFTTRIKLEKTAIPNYNLPWIIESSRAFTKYIRKLDFRQTFNPSLLK